MAPDVEGNAEVRPQTSLDDAMRELRRRPRGWWLDLARADQSHRWRRGAGVSVEEYLSHLPELLDDTEEALVLICGEVRLRRENGERPSLEQFQNRFPALSREIALQFDVDRILEAGQPTLFAREPSDLVSTLAPELPGYEFLEQIGSGASSVVYRARQTSLGRYVAIKVLVMPGADPKRLARQRQEAEILARLNHPNVVHVYEASDHGGRLYLVMEFVDGPTLKDFAAGKPLATEEAARLALVLADTMQAVHEAGVLHRDLKPSNVLVTGDAQIRITDFGLAKLRSSDNLLTTEDSVLGTPSYMSPEQAMGSIHTAGPETDIYSLGAILYELLTGRPPFLGATVLDTLSLIRDQDPVPPRQLQPSIPADLETICLHCLNKAPQNRYATAAELANDLRRFLRGEPILARRVTSVERLARWCRRNPTIAALAGAVAMLLVTAIAILSVKNASIRREAAAKDAALVTARQAVDQMLKRVADDKLNNMPLGHPLRAELLQDALKFYEGFLAQTGDDISLREEMAEVLNSMGCIQRELGRCDDACRSFERSLDLLQSIAENDPNTPALREKVVAAQEALAYTWQINPLASDGLEADMHYRRTLELYQDLNRDWPDRNQPQAHCLRHLADLAFKRGDRAEAERFWREAVASGEVYLEQHAENIDARSNVCWACADLSDAILIPSGNAAEAESVLNKGLDHAATIRQLDPRSTQAKEVTAFLNVVLAHSCCLTDRADEAIELFRRGVTEMESLCADFPWNRTYWDLANYLQREAVNGLQAAGRPDDARASLRQMMEWLQKIGLKLPNDPVPQSEWRACRTGLIKLLRTAGLDEDANKLEGIAPAEIAPEQRQGSDTSLK